jgi:1-acyl-sn-glycerol-3-phosphate acyltransferase
MLVTESQEGSHNMESLGGFELSRYPENGSQRHRIIHDHNERIGTRLQLLVQKTVVLYVLGPWLAVILRLLFRIEVRGRERLDVLGDRALLAVQHYFEWDPFITFYSALWHTALRKHHLVAQSIASPVWTRTPMRRAISWTFGVMAIVKGQEPHCGAIKRAARLLSGPEPVAISFFPTGPIGRRKSYEIYPGVAYLAMQCPAVPVVPISLSGLADVDLRSVLRLERPRLFVSVGEPFTAAELLGKSGQPCTAAICDRIAAEWGRQAERESGLILAGRSSDRMSDGDLS